MTAAEVLAMAEAEGVSITLAPDGDLVVIPYPSPDLDAAIGANVDALAALLVVPVYAPGPCAEAAGADAGGREWELPDGLLAILDSEGRFVGWTLTPGWTAECPSEVSMIRDSSPPLDPRAAPGARTVTVGGRIR